MYIAQHDISIITLVVIKIYSLNTFCLVNAKFFSMVTSGSSLSFLKAGSTKMEFRGTEGRKKNQIKKRKKNILQLEK